MPKIFLNSLRKWLPFLFPPIQKTVTFQVSPSCYIPDAAVAALLNKRIPSPINPELVMGQMPNIASPARYVSSIYFRNAFSSKILKEAIRKLPFCLIDIDLAIRTPDNAEQLVRVLDRRADVLHVRLSRPNG